MTITTIPVERQPKPLRSWQRGLCDEMRLHLDAYLRRYLTYKSQYTPELGEKLVLECIRELMTFHYDMNMISVVCNGTNNTAERLRRGELWIEVFINFNNGETFALLSWQKTRTRLKTPILTLR